MSATCGDMSTVCNLRVVRRLLSRGMLCVGGGRPCVRGPNFTISTEVDIEFQVLFRETHGARGNVTCRIRLDGFYDAHITNHSLGVECLWLIVNFID